MKKLLTSIMLIGIYLIAISQSISDPFFEKVNYIGAFDGQNNWTSGWANFDPKNTVYPDPAFTKGNGEFTLAGGLKITSDETWNGVIKLDGWVYVQAPATLTIQAGTVIRGTSKSALIIERGAKINAVGTAQSPIIFTSMNGVGLRGTSNWAGIIICGKAPKNFAGDGISEGGTGAVYGGDDPNDNSGTIKYVRIEFPGYEVATGKEINGLTLYSVGAATTIDYVQVSYSGDDAFEWFGGNVNAKHLIAYKTEDDDFDTDLGYQGMVQFAVALRDSAIVDTDAANCFESDNDEPGSANTPFTRAVFSNVSGFGPAVAAGSPAVLKSNHAGGAAMRLRRNTRLQIHNSIFAGWGIGLRLEGASTKAAAQNDSLTIQNSLIAGIRTADWFNATSRGNDSVFSNSKIGVIDPFSYTNPNFLLKTGANENNFSYWAIKNIDLTSQGGASAITTDGGSLQFFVDYSPKYLNSEFTWSIVPGTTQKATISQGGLLAASSTDGGNGTLYVKVTSLANGMADSMLITISNQSGADVLVTNINLSGAGSVSGITGSGTLTIIATILPEQASIKEVTWSVDKPEVASINAEGVLTAVSNGTVIVTATAQDGSGVKGTLSVSIIGVSVDDLTENDIIIYPNPVKDILNFRNSGGIVNLEIINVLGNVVRSMPVQYENELQIPVGELRKGVYFVRTTDENNITSVRKIFKN